MKRQLVLENGEVFEGIGFGAMQEMSGEVVFNTSMVGFQEIISDLSYCGQIVTLTYPSIGNAGLNRDDFESIHPAIHGLIVKEYEKSPSHWLQKDTLNTFLKEKNIPGLANIDTRQLTRLIREQGTMRGRICAMDVSLSGVIQQLKNSIEETDVVERVSTKASYHIPGEGKRIVLIDFGVKQSVLQPFIRKNCDIVVVPFNTEKEVIDQLHPDGIVLSNGPGNPVHLTAVTEMIAKWIGDVPVFGVGLGYQLLALACGATTEKLAYGHRGSNYPVRDLEKDKVYITSQNHGYAVNEKSLKQTELTVTHVSINDETVEGVKHKSAPAFGVQFYPTGSPGPQDADSLYNTFIKMVQQHI